MGVTFESLWGKPESHFLVTLESLGCFRSFLQTFGTPSGFHTLPISKNFPRPLDPLSEAEFTSQGRKVSHSCCPLNPSASFKPSDPQQRRQYGRQWGTSSPITPVIAKDQKHSDVDNWCYKPGDLLENGSGNNSSKTTFPLISCIWAIISHFLGRPYFRNAFPFLFSGRKAESYFLATNF